MEELVADLLLGQTLALEAEELGQQLEGGGNPVVGQLVHPDGSYAGHLVKIAADGRSEEGLEHLGLVLRSIGVIVLLRGHGFWWFS